MINDVLLRGCPRSDSASTVALSGIAYNAGTDPLVAAAVQLWSKYLIDESLLGLALDMDKQPGHCIAFDCSLPGRPPNQFFSQSWPKL